MVEISLTQMPAVRQEQFRRKSLADGGQKKAAIDSLTSPGDELPRGNAGEAGVVCEWDGFVHS